MGIVSIVDNIVSAYSMMAKKPMSSFNFIETSAGGSTLVGKDGSLMTVFRVDGVKQSMGSRDLEKLVDTMTTSLSPYLDKAGHAMQVWFARDPDLAPDLIRQLNVPARNVARRLGMELDDLFTERERNLPKYVVWEGFYIAMWTRLSVLTKDELSRIKADNKQPKAFPVAPNAQDINRAVRNLMSRHHSMVASFRADLNKVGIRCEAVEAHEAVKSIKASLYPDMVGANWRPVLPEDTPFARSPEMSKFNNSHLFWPSLDDQLFDRDGENVNNRIVRIGRHYFSGVNMSVGPQDILPFSDLLRRMMEVEEFPWRVSFLIEGNGLGLFGLKGVLASVLGLTNSENKQIKDAIKGLQNLAQNGGKVIVRLRVSFATWAPADDIRLIEDRSNRLQRAVESWGYCQVAHTAGDPLACAFSSAMGLDVTSTAPPGAPPLDDVLYMLPWNRDASPWKTGAVLFRTEDGRPWPYQPGSSLQTTWIDLVFAPPGYAKSVTMNSINLALCLSTAATAGSGGAQLPRIAIIDIGPSSSGLISLLKEALPPDRRHEAEYRRLRMIKEHAINPFDLQLGCRKPLPLERAFLVNFLTILGTPVGETKPPMGLPDLAGMAIDEVYAMLDDRSRKGQPRLFTMGEDRAVDEAIKKANVKIDATTSWWSIVDAFNDKGMHHEAMLAQRFAVPRLEDIAIVIRNQTIMDVFGEAKTTTGEHLVDVFQRMISSALREYPILTLPTRFDIGDSRVVSLDLDEAAPRGSGPAEKQTALVYMLARFVLGKDFYLNEEVLGMMPEDYREYHRKRIQRIRETPKRLVYDEFHRTESSPVVRSQVLIDMREGRKWGVHISLASQSSRDFDKNMVDFATGIWVMGAGNERAADEVVEMFGLSQTACEIIKKKLHGPTAKGAPFLAVLTLKEGRHEHLLVNTLGPTELWAFSTTAEDASLRNRLYVRLGASESRRRLASRFPGGSAKAEIDRRMAAMAEQGGSTSDEASEGVIGSLVEEIMNMGSSG